LAGILEDIIVLLKIDVHDDGTFDIVTGKHIGPKNVIKLLQRMIFAIEHKQVRIQRPS
jgi:hypothetical protein